MSRWLLAMALASAVASADAAPAAGPASKATLASAELTPAEVMARLRVLAKRKRDVLAASFPALMEKDNPDIPAPEPCKRPSEAQRKAIESTVQAWIASQPGMQGAELAGVRVGCVEPAGVVIDTQADVLTQQDRSGHWWILRVKDQVVEVLAHERGAAVNDFMEWTQETMLVTVGLADLDGDGTRDVVAAVIHHEGGAYHSETVLRTILSRGHKTVTFPELADTVGMPRAQHHRAGAPLVIEIYEVHRGDEPDQSFYRCIGTGTVLGRCDAIRTATHAAIAAMCAAGARVSSYDRQMASFVPPDQQGNASVTVCVAEGMSRWLLALVVLSSVAAADAMAAPGSGAAAPAAAPLSSAEVVAHMKALADKKLAALSSSFPELFPENTDDLPALGPCKRPDATRREAIVTTVKSWIAGQPDTHDAEEVFGMRIGCEQAAGVVVNAQADVLTEGHHQGHWWILRIKDRAVDVLAHHRGLAVNDVGEWMWESSLNGLGLVDLDRDGILDVITALDEHEGGSSTHHVVLSSITSRTRRTIKVAEFGDRVELARGQRPGAGDPVVVTISDHTNYRQHPDRFYRCVDIRPALSRCAATRTAKQFDVAWNIAKGWSQSPVSTVPDRDSLAEDLTALDAPADERARLLASAPATAPEVGLPRRIARAEISDDDRTNIERDAAERGEAAAWNARLRDALGDQPCSLAAAARARAVQDQLRAWGTGHTPTPTGDTQCAPNMGCQPATQFEIKRGCTAAGGSYYELAWGPSQSSYGLHRHALVFVAGAAITPLRDVVVMGDTAPPPAAGEPVYLGFEAAFSRKGNAAVAVILENTGTTAVIDGTVAGTVDHELKPYEVGGGIRSEVLFTGVKADRIEYWHVGRGLEPLGSMVWSVKAPDPAGALPRMLVDREINRRARDWLRGTEWSWPDAVHQLRDPGLRAELVAALTILKADRQLIDAIKALP